MESGFRRARTREVTIWEDLTQGYSLQNGGMGPQAKQWEWFLAQTGKETDSLLDLLGRITIR